MSIKDLENIIKKHLKASTKPPLLVILGPTASGKTDLSIYLAKKYHGEIVSADSRQVYKYMDIGTGKITESEKENIPHFMLDIVNPDVEFSLADYQSQAIANINGILSRGNLPIIVGGTGLYISSIIDNYQLPKAPPNEALRIELEKLNTADLHRKLEELDSESAKKIHANNRRYVIRAIEIITQEQKPKEDQKGESMFNPLLIGIDWPREELYQRIEKRIDQQIKNGFIEEVYSLLKRGYNATNRALATLGYTELISYHEGKVSLEEAIFAFKQHTRNYAKRQLTWFRRYKNIYWFSGHDLKKLK